MSERIPIGTVISAVAFLLIIYALVSYFCGSTVAGWASSLIALGVIGEYIGKICMETKARPRYIIEERTEDKP